MGDAVGVGAGRRKAVCLVNERVEVRVCLHQVWGHRERVVKVGKRRVRMRGAGVENHLRCWQIGGYRCGNITRQAFDAARGECHWLDLLWGGFPGADAPSIGTEKTVYSKPK